MFTVRLWISRHKNTESFLSPFLTHLLRVVGYNPLTHLQAVRLWKPFMLLIEE